jgi:hypothetical protein
MAAITLAGIDTAQEAAEQVLRDNQAALAHTELQAVKDYHSILVEH